MYHEKIIKREDGTHYQIRVDVYIENYNSDGAKYRVSLYKRLPKKRSWYSVNNTDDYTWRKLNHVEREAYEKKLQLEHVTPEEIMQAKLELWEKIKPV